MKRKTIGKSVRFEIFARDAFTCRYCGRQSDEVKLVIDHIIPVSKGGTNDEENLVTSCESCNSGKGVKSAIPSPENENVRLARLQQLREQKQVAKAAAEAVKLHKQTRQVLINAWCEMTGRTSVDSTTLSVVASYIEEHGFSTVLKWMEKGAAKCPSDDRRMGQYISGIRRCVLKTQ